MAAVKLVRNIFERKRNRMRDEGGAKIEEIENFRPYFSLRNEKKCFALVLAKNGKNVV